MCTDKLTHENSSQVTFSCMTCKHQRDAVRFVAGSTMQHILEQSIEASYSLFLLQSNGKYLKVFISSIKDLSPFSSFFIYLSITQRHYFVNNTTAQQSECSFKNSKAIQQLKTKLVDFALISQQLTLACEMVLF